MMRAVLVEASGLGLRARPDTLDDLDGGAAAVGEADRLDAPGAHDADAFAEDANGCEEGAVDLAAGGVGAVGELAQVALAAGSATVWSPHSHHDQARSEGTWRPVHRSSGSAPSGEGGRSSACSKAWSSTVS
ncbi:hypothetical protein [Actinacidiphila sp. ITFR-21]|uniref:hypothetical protein n=1 Tax=Actinacidiphila sp. ITFR-21 TaxID=3075199 RepID=UPI00288B1BDC|nr:hypothetical protein [Streptomyces sp. ITFR-21]WNI14069.1 hypothetical protein RLT57_00020 [Streptomyces sp. ITFR-21]